MSKFNDIIHTFQNGLLTPRLSSRVDFDSYRRSCKQLTNMIVSPQGDAVRRPGSIAQTTGISAFVPSENAWKNFLLSENSFALKFVISRKEAFIIIIDPDTYASDPLKNTMFRIYDVFNECFCDIRLGAYLISMPPITAKIASEIQYTTTNNTVYFAHPEIPPFKIFFTGPSQFAIDSLFLNHALIGGAVANVDLTEPMVFNYDSTSSMTIATTGTPGSFFLTMNSGSFFRPGMEGSLVAIQNSGNITVYYIQSIILISGSTYKAQAIVFAQVGTDLTIGTYYNSYSYSAWNKLDGYPRTVAVWNNRLIFAGSERFRQTVWGSAVGRLEVFTNGTMLNPALTQLDTDPKSLAISSDEFSKINWVKPSARYLLIGTDAREYSLNSLVLKEAIISTETSYGSEYLAPVLVEDSIVFIQRGGKKIREMTYDNRTEKFQALDLSYLAEHVFKASDKVAPFNISTVRQVAYQTLDNNILWILDSNNALFAVTKAKNEGTIAFHQHVIGGSAKVLSIASMPSKDGSTDEVYMLVKRGSITTLERITREFRMGNLHLDSADKSKNPNFLDMSDIIRPVLSNKGIYIPLVSTTDASFNSFGSVTPVSTGYDPLVFFDSKLSQLNTKEIVYTMPGASLNKASLNLRFGFQSLSARVNFPGGGAGAWGTSPEYNLVKVNGGTFEAGITVKTKAVDATAAGYIPYDIYALTFYVKDGAGDMYRYTTPFYSTPPNKMQELSLSWDLLNLKTSSFVNGQNQGGAFTARGTNYTSATLKINKDIGVPGAITVSSYKNVLFTEGFLIPDIAVSAFDVGGRVVLQNSTKDLTGLDMYNNTTISILADGNDIGDFLVTSNKITLVAQYLTLVIGYKYKSTLQPSAINFGGALGTAQGTIKRVHAAVIRFWDTAAAGFYANGKPINDVIFRDVTTPSNQPIALYTGDKEVFLEEDYDLNSAIVIETDRPLPMNIAGIMFRGQNYDG